MTSRRPNLPLSSEPGVGDLVLRRIRRPAVAGRLRRGRGGGGRRKGPLGFTEPVPACRTVAQLATKTLSDEAGAVGSEG